MNIPWLSISFSLLPALTYPFLCLAYYRLLKQKRADLNRLLKTATPQKYLNAYEDPKASLKRHFDPWSYVLPVVLNSATVVIVCLMVRFLLHRPPDQPIPILSSLPEPPTTALAGFVGAYLWAHYDLLYRFNFIDLSPSVLYSLWLRLLTGSTVGYTLGLTLESPFDLVVALGIGAFPLDTIRRLLQARVGKVLDIGDASIPSEKPSLHLLQGATQDVIGRLAEEGITSVQHLALANPMKLLLKTNIEWTVILDLMDQAMLQIVVVEDKVSKLRAISIRGAIGLAEVWEAWKDGDPAEKKRADLLLGEVASAMNVDRPAVENLAETVYEDPQVDFVWQLWLEAFELTQPPAAAPGPSAPPPAAAPAPQAPAPTTPAPVVPPATP